ncbi:MAG: FtsX-like permease family protein, partial [Oscillospiraceae bacterium]
DIIAVDNYVPRYLNQAIIFSIDDIGGDEAGTMVMCYMMIAIIAFIFAVTISNTIVSEAGVIGTLRASGYTKGELIRHYMILPIIVTFAAAVVGNVIGYTVMKDFFVNLYRDSYSLTTYKTIWDPSAFLLSTVVPIVLMLLINLTVLVSKLKLSPLKFLRHDLKKNRNKKAMRLNTKIPFKTRFSLRIFFTNLPGYIVMIIGILFGAVIISFGDMFPRMLDSYKDIIIRDMISEYQYVLYDCEEADEITDVQAEKYASSSFDYSKEGYLTDSITVYGTVKNSRYIHAEIPEGKALISTGISEKFGLGVGDIITLDEKYKRDSSYEIEIGGIYDYQSSLAIFINIDDYNSIFGEKPNYFTGYFSNSELTELDNDDIAAVITANDYTKLSDQLTVSMSGMMDIFKWFGAMFFVIVVYVLCKQVIERNFQSIAMTKILGFRNGEIGSLYIASTSIAVLVGLIISIPFIDIAMRAVFKGYLYTMMTGFIPYIMSPMTYIVTVSTGLICYAVVALLQIRKVSRVSKSEALKNVE